MEVFILVIFGAIAYAVYKIGFPPPPPVKIDENIFYQNGVTVNFPEGTISFAGLNAFSYPVSQITGIKSEASQPGRERWLRTVTVKIELDNLAHPVQRVKFTGAYADNHAQDFTQRLATAVRKAGGRSFV